MKKKKQQIKFICPKCGKEPMLNKEKSTLYWKVTNSKCPICEVQCEIKLI